MIKLGIECENLEDAKSRWGIGHLVLNLLKEYEKNPEWQKTFKLYLYFKSRIPEDPVLKNPVVIKRILKLSLNSFNIFYHILLPIRAMLDRVDFMFFPAYQMPPLYLGKAIVLLTNDVYYEYKFGTIPFRYKLAYRLFTNWAAKFAYKILTISDFSRNEVSRFYKIDKKKIIVSKLGVEEKKETPKRIIDGDYLLCVGQMFPRRHAKEIILAFEKIANDLPNLKLVLVGKDKYPASPILKLVNNINKSFGRERIIYYDYIESDEDIKSIYAHAKLFIYISDYEAFGLPPVEAASYGIPLVVTDNELNRELFDKAAFFVESPVSIQNIAETIKKGISNWTERGYCQDEYPNKIKELTWYNFAKNFFENVK